ncbi:MAG: hypothetical protein Q7V15_05660 [Phenylobacterium sp.]|uniref:hypothetical protein n=1 Tax=Phenylobacterium sp. TaxID=1871053 RepID=UPI002728F9AA|nr:hypothetical protein [Phenylobacterium sp.]MDO8900825.1 hypothetical protein [Phenylobacterium sp.]
MQRFETNVVFICPKCGETAASAVEVPEPDWSAAEQASDLYSEGETEVHCSVCGEAFAAYVNNSSGTCQVKLDDFPLVKISCDLAFYAPEESEDWIELEITGDPYGFFIESYRQATSVLVEHGEHLGAHIINRMVFSQQVTALEAYLSDTLIKGVNSSPDAMQRLIENDKDLLAERVTLAEIAKNPNVLNERVKSYLRSVLYHNLQRVDFLYRTAFEVRVLGTKDENKHLLEAIQNRHHCVHRNGIDLDGNRLIVFTPEYVQITADRMKAVVDRIQSQLIPF